jgi:predicted RNase H-like nuclease (RuvC/YqgF family)
MQELQSYHLRFQQVNKHIRETQKKPPAPVFRKSSQPASDCHWDLQQENEQLRTRIRAQEREIAALKETVSRLSSQVKPTPVDLVEQPYPAILKGTFEHYFEKKTKAAW